MARPIRILVYGDVDMNVIDGSSVWQQSVVRMLQRNPRAEITVQLKRNLERDVLTAPLAGLDRVRLINQPPNEGRRLLAERAPAILSHLDKEAGGFDIVLLRGYRLCLETARHGDLDGRLWCYVTDFPQDPRALTDQHVSELKQIADASRYVLCQTDEMRSYLEAHVDAVHGKTALLSPVVPDMAQHLADDDAGSSEGLRIVYAGKFTRLWRTEEIVASMPGLRRAIPGAELLVIGDKIHNEPDDPGFAERMRSALENTEGVHWLGALPRDDVQSVVASSQFGYSVRDPALDESLELSTKLLEYGRAGVPPLLNRTSMHERLLGPDYPLFISPEEDLGVRLRQVLADPATYTAAREAAWHAATRHTIAAGAAELEHLLNRACPEPVVSVYERRRVLLVGHDLKFTTPLVEHLEGLPNVELRVEQWDGVADHDEAISRENLIWADCIWAEWCLQNAVWFGRHRLPQQRLVSRFHLFERDTPYPGRLAEDDVDHVAFVGAHILREMTPKMQVPPERLSVIPNAVPTSHMRRPKLHGARFNLGILGVSPWRKRLDLAVETVRLVREQDERFTLFVKGHLPIDYWWIWAKERESYLELMDRVNNDPLLRESVVFDGFGSDVAQWFRKVGFILSPSDFESFHLAVAEGIASGSVPLIWPWEGADELYPDETLVASPEEAASAILEATSTGEPQRRQAQALAAPPDRELVEVCRTWERLLLAPR